MAYRAFFHFEQHPYIERIVTYDQQILKVLTEAGDKGLSMKAISMHVFNMNNTFFVSPDFEEIRTYVKQYLLRWTMCDNSPCNSARKRKGMRRK